MPGTATKLEISVIRKPAQAGVDVAEAALEWMAARRIRRWFRRKTRSSGIDVEDRGADRVRDNSRSAADWLPDRA
jgi:hypothetical protein